MKNLYTDQIYHVFNRGVEDRIIFNDRKCYERLLETFRYYQKWDVPIRFSFKSEKLPPLPPIATMSSTENLVEIIAYCLMPTHYHFLLKQVKDGGITRFIFKTANSYSRYFNARHKRKGHLFGGVFKAVKVEDDNQLLHLSRYIHLNPIVADIVANIREYPYSSYNEYLQNKQEVCNKDIILSSFPNIASYEKFVLDQIDYARQLKAMQKIAMDLDFV